MNAEQSCEHFLKSHVRQNLHNSLRLQFGTEHGEFHIPSEPSAEIIPAAIIYISGYSSCMGHKTLKLETSSELLNLPFVIPVQ